MGMSEAVQQRLDELVRGDRVVLFMKGSRHFPQCGFSATVTQILDGLVKDYTTVNVLSDPEIREGVKEFSSWPTIPQLYVDGQFVGGCDIVRDMYLAGELQQLLGVEENVAAPELSITDLAKQALKEAGAEGGYLRLVVSPQFQYELALDEPQKGDFQVDAGGTTVLIDRGSAARANGIRIDYSTEQGGGFSIDNPNEPPRVKPLSPGGLKRLLDAGRSLHLIDVRTPEEQQTASIAGARLLDDELERELQDLDKEEMLVFICHHGVRSQKAAQRFVEQGFRNAHNLQGGIDAWSKEVDPSVPTY